ncbi:MAG: phosphoribosylglycinamide formyltransferase [Actinomycetia bacterium]|nr:phosphoribosylglycinamide formyltransferase [Actinomycetes bacterium]MCP5031319.1 phosphoribosylglycinamide formyltransferase [Actinomycetes bacterium]
MSPASKPRLAVLVSGSGSNLAAIIAACSDGSLEAEIGVVISNRVDAYALERAKDAGIAVEVAPHEGTDRASYDQDLAYTVASHDVDLVVLAGWDRILTTYFVSHHRTINLHPAKPGTFRGLGAIERAFAAWQEGTIDHGGVMVHYVPDEGVDDGPVISWEPVPFVDGDTLHSYSERVHQVEHRILVASIGTVLAEADMTGGRR